MVRRWVAIISLVFAGLLLRPDPGRAKTLEQQTHDFVTIAEKQNRGEVHLSAIEIRKLCADLASMAHTHLVEHKVEIKTDSNSSSVSIKILPTGPSSLNQLAKRLAESGRVSVEFDVTYLFFHPYAAASFIQKTGELVLSHSSIHDLNVDAPEIQHELVHVEIWQKLKRSEPSPFFGYLIGEAFKPDALHLDEMEAYYRDLDLALQRFDDFLAHIKNPSAALADARLKEILESRLAGNPPMESLNPFELAWDNAVKKIVHGLWHTQPAVDALDVVDAALKAGGMATFASADGLVSGELPAKLKQETFTAHMDLANSRAPADPSNRDQFKSQVAWSRDTANERLAFWHKAEKEFRLAVNVRPVEERWKAVKRLHRQLYAKSNAVK